MRRSVFALALIIGASVLPWWGGRVLATPPRPPPTHAARTGIAAQVRPRTLGASDPPSPPQVFLLVLENHSANEIIGNTDAPYLNRLAARGGLATNYSAIRHPSLPNYLALTGGSTFGITSDCTSCVVHTSSLADQMDASGISWKTYAESLPRPCFLGASSADYYVKKHNPFLYYAPLAKDRPRCRKHILGFDALTGDIRGATLPDFGLIVPNEAHDMHSGSVHASDRFLKTFLPDLLATDEFQKRGVLFITFDEGNGRSNRVATIMVSPATPAGTRSDTRFDHYSLLKTIEELFGLPLLRHAGRPSTQSLSSVFLT